MFGFFNKTPYIPAPAAEVAKEPEKDMSAYYTIGLTPNDRTQITFGQRSNFTSSLTMTDDAVAHMIRLLAVNISDSYAVTVTPITHQPVDDTDPSDLVTDAI